MKLSVNMKLCWRLIRKPPDDRATIDAPDRDANVHATTSPCRNAARGINGPIDDLLFPIHHGILYYPGFDVLPPFVVYRTGKTDAARYAGICEALGERLDTLESATPIAFRPQNASDYAIPALTLRDEIAPGVTGFAAHVRSA